MAYKIVVMGASLGGVSALGTLFEELPSDFPLPIAVVHHRGAASGPQLRSLLQKHARLRLREPLDKDPIEPGFIYLAPADYHLLVEDDHLSLSTEGRVSYARPSIDVLFESAAYSYAEGTIAIALTGANRDGARGAAVVKEQGGYLIVQDPKSAECPVLPKTVLDTTSADRIAPLREIAAVLRQLGDVV
ncbi:MAG: chemotaxis protein CheB [Armatimonadetes bacterium]|nr:chemotaxis protein CheB [Armatimonadota bacterium]